MTNKSGRAGVALVIAAIILISGLYVRFSFNQPDQVSFGSYPYYEDIMQSTFGVGAMQTRNQTFEGISGEKFSLRLYVNSATADGSPADPPTFRIAVNVSDSAGNNLLYDENVGRTYSLQPIELKSDGTAIVGITNLGDEPIEVNMNLGKSNTVRPLDNGFEHFSNWLIIVSAPIFALGIWLLIPRKNANAAPAAPASQ